MLVVEFKVELLVNDSISKIFKKIEDALDYVKGIALIQIKIIEQVKIEKS